MKKSISILGCGWLGFPLAKHLKTNGNSLKGSTTTFDKLEILKEAGINPFLINTHDLNENILEFLNSETLIILITSKEIEEYKRLISFIEQSTIENIIFISSTSVYCESNQLVDEEAETKNSALINIERLFTSNKKFNTTVIRFSGLFGYSRKPGNFFKKKNAIPNPKGYVNMIHQDDCILIIEQIILQRKWGYTLNACTDTHPTRQEFYTKAALDMNRTPLEFAQPEINRFKIISNIKLKHVLNYKFKYPDLMNMNLA